MRGVTRESRSLAVLIRPKEEGISNAIILKRVRDKISPKDFNIKSVCLREAINGGILVEVFDPDATSESVDALAGAIGEILSGCASVSRPARKVEFRLRGLDPSIASEELREAIAKAGGCPVAAVSVSGMGRMNSGHRVAWISCPVSVARSLSEGKYLTVEWSSATIDSMRLKKLQCFRCWRYGHARGACKAPIDRSGHCFRCGEEGHMAGECRNNVVCVLCKDSGLDCAHKMGSNSCKSANPLPTPGRW